MPLIEIDAEDDERVIDDLFTRDAFAQIVDRLARPYTAQKAQTPSSTRIKKIPARIVPLYGLK